MDGCGVVHVQKTVRRDTKHYLPAHVYMSHARGGVVTTKQGLLGATDQKVNQKS